MKISVESGYFDDSIPYVKIGNKDKIIINIEGLSFVHEPLSGSALKQFIKANKSLTDEYTVYNLGRRPNLPKNYLVDKIAKDYAVAIKREFEIPVDLVGISTGGQIIQNIAADYPEIVHKAVILSAAYRWSEKGRKIGEKATEYFNKKEYGKCMATIVAGMYDSKLKKAMILPIIRLMAKRVFGDNKYPNDFLNELIADREMNFKERLHEIKCPTLIIAGAKDQYYDIDDIRETAKGISNSKLIIYEKYGHDLTMWKIKEINRQIKEFLTT